MAWVASLALAFLWLAGTEADYQSAKRKFALIESGQVPPGSYVSLRPGELEAYAGREVRKVAPQGVREPRVELGHDEATGFAFIDFPKLRQATGQPLGWLLTRLLAGERPVQAKVRIRSGGGVATVHLERLAIGGLTLRGAALQFLLDNFLLPYYPEAKIGQPFELEYGIERLEVRPTEVRVVMGP